MLNNTQSLKEIFTSAFASYKNKDFKSAELSCYKILNIDPNHFDSLSLLATISAVQNNFEKARDLMHKVVSVQPKNAAALNNLGTTYKRLNKLKEARSFFEKALKINPNHTNANYNLGILFYALSDLKNAKKYLNKTVEVQNNYAIAYHSLAEVNLALKEVREALRCYQKAIEINPNLVATHNNLGLLFRDLNDFPNAIKCFENALKLVPKYVNSLHNLAEIYKEIGEFDKSINLYTLAVKYEPENLMNVFFLSEMKKETLTQDVKEKAKNILSNKEVSLNNLAYGNYLLAKYERKAKNYEKEIDYLIKGHSNFYIRNKKVFDINLKYCFEDVHQIIQNGKIDKIPSKNKNKIHPIFIFGVPRSGSTLVERIIVSGERTISLGEETGIIGRYFLNKVLQKNSLNFGDVNEIRDELFNLYKERGLILENSNFTFTDKSLDNYLYINFLKEIYPNAKFIHCKRNKLSSIVSILQNNITQLSWTHHPENIFKYFDNYIKVMNDMMKKNSDIIYDLQFEDLVINPEEESKKLMEFCEIPWDKKCLEFYKRKDLKSKTASNIQIRKAIYQQPSDKYKPYKKLLDKYGKKYTWFK